MWNIGLEGKCEMTPAWQFVFICFARYSTMYWSIFGIAEYSLDKTQRNELNMHAHHLLNPSLNDGRKNKNKMLWGNTISKINWFLPH